ncbi:hypothetical protein Q3C01_25285 [Bradyrhizobium sp. UFLA05-109]
MRTASMAALLWLALSAMATAQGGGYPASPSHAVVGTTADGTPRYGREPRTEQGTSSNTVGYSGAFDSNGKQDRTPDASNSDDDERTNGGSQKRDK